MDMSFFFFRFLLFEQKKKKGKLSFSSEGPLMTGREKEVNSTLNFEF